MEFTTDQQTAIEAICQEEFNEPTNTLGFRLREYIWDETGKYMSPETTNELNNWQDQGDDLILGWREFINWCWEAIKRWWNDLWN